jgi:2,3-bisphosphoglycerate-dependent phosphoglycerate mutase
MNSIYFVRHAHAEWTPDEERPLSAKGSEDAKRVADELHGYPISSIYSSPARRALQTISPLAERIGIPIEIEPDLRERNLGEGVFDDFFQAVRITWRNPTFAHPGGESSADAQKRGIAVVMRLQAKHPDQAIVLSTHGNLMALILKYFTPSIGYEFWESLSMPDIFVVNVTSAEEIEIIRLWDG